MIGTVGNVRRVPQTETLESRLPKRIVPDEFALRQTPVVLLPGGGNLQSIVLKVSRARRLGHTLRDAVFLEPSVNIARGYLALGFIRF